MRGFNSDYLSEFSEIIESKNNKIALQERDMDALKREIKQLKHQINSSKAKKK